MIRFFVAALPLLIFGCQPERQIEKAKMRPSDHLFYQRVYPDTHFDFRGWERELDVIRKDAQRQYQRSAGAWVTQGPGNAGARINTIAVHPRDHRIMLIGFSAGGIYKTMDGGLHWEPVFDDFSILAVGDIVFDESNPNIVYVGTGDPNISGIPFVGKGIYRSTDTGDTWNYLGLEEAGIIAKIVIDPEDPQVMYAASMGIPFYRDGNRGLYKTTNGGQNWEQVLFLGEGTGVIDVAINPEDSRILYAAGWDRIRNYEESTTTGEGARIYKSTDGGTGWTMLGGGLPNQVHSRIGIELAHSNPDRLYAVYVDTSHELEEVFTSTDAGQSWSALPIRSGSGMGTQPLAGFGWYFGKIRLNPSDEEDLYLLGVRLWRFNARSKRWSRVDQFTADVVHVDKHDLIFAGPDTLLLATDGGLYRSTDNAASWYDIEDIPATQFYRVAYNPHNPDLFYGGAQDNGSLSGNKEDLAGWTQYFGGDGFRTIFHPDDPNIYYVETQSGGFYVTRDSGQSYEPATKGINGSDYVNWDAPVIMSQHDPDVLYFGTDRVYRSETGPDEDFKAISDQLTDDTVFLDATANITALAESPFDLKVIFAGTGDGNLYLTEDYGLTWQKSDAGLPDRYLTAIIPSPTNAAVLFVTHSGFRSGERIPHIHRSDDLGKTWIDISGDLPSIPVNDLLVLPNNADQVLFAGTDAGVYFSRDGGRRWLRLGNNMPVIPVFDLEYHPVKNLLIAGTHAKSIMTFDLLQEGIQTDVHTAVNDYRIEVFSVSPNPASDYLQLQTDLKAPVRLTIIDLSGRIQRDQLLHGNRIDISDLEAGVYYLRLWSQQNIKRAAFLKH